MQNPMTMLPGIGGLFDDSEDKAMSDLQQNIQDYQNIQAPNLTFTSYVPEAAQYQTISEDPNIKNRQMSLLDMLQGNADRGISDADLASYQKATQTANLAAGQRNQALLNEAAARGIGGSGVELGLREAANQGAMSNANANNLDRAANSAQLRAAYQNAYGNQLGNVRNQDYQTAANNAGIINAFNQYNTGNRNQAQLYNAQMPNQLAQQGFTNQMTRAGAINNARLGQVQGYAAQNAADTANRKENTNLIGQIIGSAMGNPMAMGGGGGSDNSQQNQRNTYWG